MRFRLKAPWRWLRCLALVALVGMAVIRPGLAQLPPRGTSEREEFDRAVFRTPSFLLVRLEIQRAGKDEVMEAMIECLSGRHHPALGSMQSSYNVKIPSRSFIGKVLGDGSVIFLHLPPSICAYWPEKWMPEEFARNLKPETRFPENFLPFLSWADRQRDPEMVVEYRSRPALMAANAEITFKRLKFTVLNNAEERQHRRRALREAEDAITHPIMGYNRGRLADRAEKWPAWTSFLYGVPAHLWTQYPNVLALVLAHNNGHTPVVFPDEDVAPLQPDIKEMARLLSGGGLGSASGLPEPDGRGGVLNCEGPDYVDRQSVTFLRRRCNVPYDWHIPVVCDYASGCQAHLDRVGATIYVRGGTRPSNVGPIHFDGVEARRSQYGRERLLYLPTLRLLVIL